MSAGGRRKASIKTLWGLAKSPELSMSSEELYRLVQKETGKDSLRALSQGELDRVALALEQRKDRAKTPPPIPESCGKGRPETAAQRRKIYKLCETLGWVESPKRLQGFIQSMFAGKPRPGEPVRSYRLEWLTRAQCSAVIEGLKKMIEKEERGHGEAEADEPEGEGGTGADKKAAPGGGAAPAR